MKQFTRQITKLYAATLMAALSMSTVNGASSTSTFGTQLIIQVDCDIIATTNMDFGTHGVLAADIDVTSNLGIQCTDATSYDIGLNFGVNGFRNLSDGASNINYDLYSNSARTVFWDDLPFGAVTATGNGAVQNYTVYGRVFAQTTPAPGTFTDTVTVTVTF